MVRCLTSFCNALKSGRASNTNGGPNPAREHRSAQPSRSGRKAPRFLKSDFRNLRNLQDPKLRPRKGICPTIGPQHTSVDRPAILREQPHRDAKEHQRCSEAFERERHDPGGGDPQSKGYHYRSPACDLRAIGRSKTFLTDIACQAPPRGVGMPRAFRASATARKVVAPAFWASRMIGNANNETQVRREFLDPLFKALGWDIDNQQGYRIRYADGRVLEAANRH
jgi:hypothetical protein